MGVKVPIGKYTYNKKQPQWLITIGGVMQGLSYFWGICGVYALLAMFGARDSEKGYFILAILVAIVLVIFNQVVGKRLAIGKGYKPKALSNTQTPQEKPTAKKSEQNTYDDDEF